MANPPDSPDPPPKRPKDPRARDPRPKDPARPTRAKAAREVLPPIAPALADLLNPAINRGTAGVGSQTGLDAPPSGLPPSGLRPPADNSRDRRNDFAAAHQARASTPEGFGERAQASYIGPDGQPSGYVGKTPRPGDSSKFIQRIGPGELDPDLARALGITDDDGESAGASGAPPGPAAATDAKRPSAKALALPRVLPPPGTGEDSAVAATASALENLLREGRAEFRDQDQPWVPHRPPRPEKSEGGQRFVTTADFVP